MAVWWCVANTGRQMRYTVGLLRQVSRVHSNRDSGIERRPAKVFLGLYAGGGFVECYAARNLSRLFKIELKATEGILSLHQEEV